MADPIIIDDNGGAGVQPSLRVQESGAPRRKLFGLVRGKATLNARIDRLVISTPTNPNVLTVPGPDLNSFTVNSNSSAVQGQYNDQSGQLILRVNESMSYETKDTVNPPLIIDSYFVPIQDDMTFVTVSHRSPSSIDFRQGKFIVTLYLL